MDDTTDDRSTEVSFCISWTKPFYTVLECVVAVLFVNKKKTQSLVQYFDNYDVQICCGLYPGQSLSQIVNQSVSSV